MAEEEPPSASTPLVGPSSGGGNGGVTKPPSHSPPVADLVNPWVLASLALPLATFASGFTGAVADVPMKYYFYDTLGLGANQYYVYSASDKTRAAFYMPLQWGASPVGGGSRSHQRSRDMR